MSFKTWIKANAADRALLPIREQLISLIEPNTSVLDVGCGTGDLLVKAADKVSSGMGIDLDQQMIDYANSRVTGCSLSHIVFQRLDARLIGTDQFDLATSTLCIHELERHLAYQVLENMTRVASRVLIADYSKPDQVISKVGIELDELISGHYSRFREYRQHGYLAGYAEECGLRIVNVIPGSIEGMSIWEISK